jgi:excisionase family DNA binding protein
MTLTVKQVADELGVSPTCVYQLISTGKLVAHRFGVGRGTIRVFQEDLSTFVAESRNEKRPAAVSASRKRVSNGGFKHLRLGRSPD